MWLLDEFGFSTAKTEAQLEAAFEAYFNDSHNFDSYSCRAWMMTSFPDLENRPFNQHPLPPAYVVFLERGVANSRQTDLRANTNWRDDGNVSSEILVHQRSSLTLVTPQVLWLA